MWLLPINFIFSKFHTIRLNFFSSKVVKRHLAHATKDLKPQIKSLCLGALVGVKVEGYW